MITTDKPLWLLNQEEEDRKEKGHRPTMQELGIYCHSTLNYGKYEKHVIECDGVMEILEAFGTSREDGMTYDFAYVTIRCSKCEGVAALKNPCREARVAKNKGNDWRDRGDIGKRQQINF